jgi:hypothetical protein
MKLVFLEDGEKLTATKIRSAVQEAILDGYKPKDDGYFRGYISDEGRESLLSDTTFEGLIEIIKDGSIFEEEPKHPMRFSGITFSDKNLVAIIE